GGAILCSWIAGKSERTASANQLDVNVSIVSVFPLPGIGDVVPIGREGRAGLPAGRTREGHDVGEGWPHLGILGSMKPRCGATDDDRNRQCSAGGPPTRVRRLRRALGERSDEGPC